MRGCPCRESGQWLALTRHGGPERLGRLCFRGGTGQAVPRAAGVGDCTGRVPAGVLRLRAGIAYQEPQQLLLEPLSGQPRVMACGEGDAGRH